jgi:hypothetical protein
MAKEERAVSNFHRVRMQDFGVLDIRQGDQELLIVETDEDTMSKIYTEVQDGELILRIGRGFLERLGVGLQTSLTRPRLRYHLTVKELSGLTVAGFGRVEIGDLTAGSFSVRLAGGGDIAFSSLTADSVDVELSGAGQVEIQGKVKEQRVSLSGAGRYAAGKLESQRASVTMSGAGNASVWASEDLDVTLSGVGSVEYYGNPTVKQRTSGLGSIHQADTH